MRGAFDIIGSDLEEAELKKFAGYPREKGRDNALELEIAKEKAGSLGIAGKKLQHSIDRYHEMFPAGATHRRDGLAGDVADNLWALIVQREVVGLRHDNVKWVLQNYDVPEAALTKLGLVGRLPRAS